MSSSTRISRMAAIAASALGVAAVLAAAVVGLTGWPPSFAVAAPSTSRAMLGVEEDTAVALGAEVDPDEKFAAAAAVATTTAAAHQRLLAPAAKKAGKVPAKKARKRVSRSAAAAIRAAGSGSWRKARVSWYGPGLYGNGMAGGGKLRRNSMVVAHRSLPFGTKIEFKYRGRKVTAVVKDRGPFIRGRVFDLGPGTAKALRFSGVGTVTYRIVR